MDWRAQRNPCGPWQGTPLSASGLDESRTSARQNISPPRWTVSCDPPPVRKPAQGTPGEESPGPAMRHDFHTPPRHLRAGSKVLLRHPIGACCPGLGALLWVFIMSGDYGKCNHRLQNRIFANTHKIVLSQRRNPTAREAGGSPRPRRMADASESICTPKGLFIARLRVRIVPS